MDKQQKDVAPKDSYRTVGFHRLLGGWYYSMLTVLVGSLFFIGMFAIVLPMIMKYPEIEGYSKIVYGFLGFAFGFFDMGSTRGQDADVGGQLNDGLLRFVGEYEHTDPKRAFKYIQVFTWFQMFTGIVQIAIISAVTLWWLPFTSVAHLGWFFLAYSLIQFPGCLQIFESIFKGFGQIHLFTIYTFLKDTVIKYTSQIGCILIGSAIGRANPALGEVMGATIGLIFSYWLNMIITFVLGVILFRRRMKSYGVSAGDLFAVDFNMEIVKQTLGFSAKLWIGSLAQQAGNFIVNIMYLALIPNVGVYLGLISFASQVSGLPGMQGVMMRNSTPALAEAYANGKPNLFRFYVMSLLRYHGFITSYFLIPLIVFLPPIFGGLVNIIDSLAYYSPIVRMLPLLMIGDALLSPPDSLSGRLLTSLNKPFALVILDLIAIPIKFILIFLFAKLGFTWETIVLTQAVRRIVSISIRFIYVQKKIIKLPWNSFGFYWQSYIVPIIIAVITIPLLLLARYYFVIPLMDLGKPLITIVAGVGLFLFGLFLYPMFIYTPLYAALGGFDDYGIELFEKSVNLSGPSQFITKPMLWFIKISSKRSKLHNRFPMPGIELAEQERIELNQMGLENRKKD